MNRGEVPGYEFEVPRGPLHRTGHDSLHQLRHAQQPEPAPRSPVRAVGSGVLAVMRTRNWVLGLALPILAAVIVGIAAVVIVGGGGNGGAAPSALAAGFPPARLAGPDFGGPDSSGTGGTSRVVLTAIGASAATEVVAGGANGGPALWVSADGGSVWTRAVLDGPAPLTQAGAGELTGVAHGAAGWLAVGTTLAGTGGPLVAASRDAQTWTVASGIPGLGAASPAAASIVAAVAAGPAGYVIVGHQPAGRVGAAATAWYAPGLTGWRRATITEQGQQGQQGTSGGQMMNAVTATARGFTAVGAAGTRPAAWLSAVGRVWREVPLPVPVGSARAALDDVAANGTEVVAAGTDFTATGASSPFAEVSVNAGTTWTLVQLPVPDLGPETGATVTALTAAGGGFTATGTYPTTVGPEVVVWTLPPGAPVTAWLTVTPQGVGLASSATRNAITALTADGVTLTGVGFTAALTASGTPGAQQPTLWQSPIRN
jgi:hypothetical protein